MPSAIPDPAALKPTFLWLPEASGSADAKHPWPVGLSRALIGQYRTRFRNCPCLTPCPPAESHPARQSAPCRVTAASPPCLAALPRWLATLARPLSLTLPLREPSLLNCRIGPARADLRTVQSDTWRLFPTAYRDALRTCCSWCREYACPAAESMAPSCGTRLFRPLASAANQNPRRTRNCFRARHACG